MEALVVDVTGRVEGSLLGCNAEVDRAPLLPYSSVGAEIGRCREPSVGALPSAERRSLPQG